MQLQHSKKLQVFTLNR